MKANQLKDWINSNRPPKIRVSLEEVSRKTGLLLEGQTFYSVDRKGWLTIGALDLEIEWWDYTSAFNVTYVPHIGNYCSMCGSLDQTICNLFETKVMDCPEQIVILPIPEWIAIRSEDPYSSIESIELFASDANEAVDSFMKKLSR